MDGYGLGFKKKNIYQEIIKTEEKLVNIAAADGCKLHRLGSC